MACRCHSCGNLDSDKKSEIKPTENNTKNMKNISSFMSKDLIAAAGFNVETPIVDAIIGNLAGTLPTKKNEAEMIKCKICDCELSSKTALSIHTNGIRHKKRLKALEIIAQLKDANSGVHLGDRENPNAFRCKICSKTVNSAQQLGIHLSSAKHKRKVIKANVLGTASNPLKNYLEFHGRDNSAGPIASKKRKPDSKAISCVICNVFVNSQTQYDEHLLSKRHLTKANRTPQKQLPESINYMKLS